MRAAEHAQTDEGAALFPVYGHGGVRVPDRPEGFPDGDPDAFPGPCVQQCVPPRLDGNDHVGKQVRFLALNYQQVGYNTKVMATFS